MLTNNLNSQMLILYIWNSNNKDSLLKYKYINFNLMLLIILYSALSNSTNLLSYGADLLVWKIPFGGLAVLLS